MQDITLVQNIFLIPKACKALDELAEEYKKNIVYQTSKKDILSRIVCDYKEEFDTWPRESSLLHIYYLLIANSSAHHFIGKERRSSANMRIKGMEMVRLVSDFCKKRFDNFFTDGHIVNAIFQDAMNRADLAGIDFVSSHINMHTKSAA